MTSALDPEKVSLDKEEQWYEDHFDDFVAASPEIRQSLVDAAVKAPNVVSSNKQMVSIRLDPQDIKIIKEKAERAGLAYQTMVAALLHQYAVGDLVNIEEARKVLRIS